jgi:hypothetical protein
MELLLAEVAGRVRKSAVREKGLKAQNTDEFDRIFETDSIF